MAFFLVFFHYLLQENIFFSFLQQISCIMSVYVLAMEYSHSFSTTTNNIIL